MRTELQKAEEALLWAKQFLGHKGDCCSNNYFGDPSSDYCDCGFAEAYGRYRWALGIVKEKLERSSSV